MVVVAVVLVLATERVPHRRCEPTTSRSHRIRPAVATAAPAAAVVVPRRTASRPALSPPVLLRVRLLRTHGLPIVDHGRRHLLLLPVLPVLRTRNRAPAWRALLARASARAPTVPCSRHRPSRRLLVPGRRRLAATHR